MKKSEAINTFQQGLVSDFNPMMTQNNVLVNALNATIITRNGNENALQNDMGNGRVETAFLPEGYIPVGTCQLGGIIYIVSYNPFTSKCQIGSFPSPERNLSSEEISNSSNVQISDGTFKNGENINKLIYKAKLSDVFLSPGDKYKVAAQNISTAAEYITDMDNKSYKNIKFNLATIDNNGRIIYLSDLIKYQYDNRNFPFQNGIIESGSSSDLDEYRKLIGSDYNIYSSRVAGNLYVVAELEVINSFDVNWNLISRDNGIYTFQFDITTESDNGNNFLQYVKVQYQDKQSSYERDSSETNQLTISNFQVDKQDSPVTIDFIPAMKFGYLEYLKRSINIDFSLLDSNTISSNLWRYYKENNQMVLNYDLSFYLTSAQQLESISLYFIPYEQIPESIPTTSQFQGVHDKKVILQKRKSYSGNYTTKIQFDDSFKQDYLYLVLVQSKINSSQGGSEYRNIFHVLYTNGVFNQTYSDGKEDNFDMVQLNLGFKPDFLVDTSQLSMSTSSIHEPFISTDEWSDALRCRGYSKSSVNGNIQINSKVKILEDFNTFSTNSNISSLIDISTQKNLLQSTGEATNTGLNNIDQDYVKIKINQNEDGTVKYTDSPTSNMYDSQFGLNQYKAVPNTQSASNKVTLSLVGEFYNKISSTYQEKTFNIKNYVSPLVNNSNDLNNYGLKIQNGHFVFSDSVFVALGISAGGLDNDGGGGMYIHQGSISFSKQDNGYLKSNAQYAYHSDGTITTFPINDTSSYIDSLKSNIPFIPIVLVRTGGVSFRTQENDVVFHSGGRDGKINADKLKRNFEHPWTCKYYMLWLFCKTDNVSQAVYVPLNTFFKVSDIDLYDTKNSSCTVADYIGTLLLYLYSKKEEGHTVDRLGLDYISYFDTVKNTIKINFKSKLSYSNQDYVNFKGTSLNEIEENFKDLVQDVQCFKYSNPDTTQLYDLDIEYDINTPNKLKEQYIESSVLSIIDTYVKSDQSIETPDTVDSSKLYYIKDNKLQIFEGSNMTIPKVSNLQLVNSDITYNTIDGSTLFNLSNSNMFTYNYRDNLLTLNGTYYNSQGECLMQPISYNMKGDSFSFRNLDMFSNKSRNLINYKDGNEDWPSN